MERRTQQIDLIEGQAHTLAKLGDLWCNFMHTSAMWPIHGHYRCAECGREYPVPWGIQ